VAGIARRCGLDSPAEELVAAASEDAELRDEQPYLLLRERAGSVMALELSAVARLEEFQRGQVELAGGRQMVQYRERILPLLFLADLLGLREEEELAASGSTARLPRVEVAPATAALDSLSVVVYETDQALVGLVVDEVSDIVSVDMVACERGPSSRPGIRSTAVIQGEIAEVIDLEGLLASPAVRPRLSWSGA